MTDNQFSQSPQNNPEYQTETGIPPLKPNTWLWQSILVTLCCFPVFGIIAMFNSLRVNSFYYSGFYEKSLQASKRARNWAFTGLIAGIIYLIVATILMLKGSYLEEIGNILNDGGHSIYNY